MNPTPPTRKKRTRPRTDKSGSPGSLELEISHLRIFMERLAEAGENRITNDELLSMVESYGLAGSRLANMIRTAQSLHSSGQDPEITQAIHEFIAERRQKAKMKT